MSRERILHFIRHAHFTAHGSYLALVTVESHGLYGYAALALLIIMVIGALLGEE